MHKGIGQRLGGVVFQLLVIKEVSFELWSFVVVEDVVMKIGHNISR
jgi:hypothetical protein